MRKRLAAMDEGAGVAEGEGVAEWAEGEAVAAPGCAAAQGALPELALGVLPPAERHGVEAHLGRCPACRSELQELAGIASRLLDLVPGTEPPVGFEERVLGGKSLGPPAGAPSQQALRRAARLGLRRVRGVSRRRRVAWAGAVGAAAALAIGSLAASGGLGHPPARTPPPAVAPSGGKPAMEAQLLSGQRSVGEAYAYRGSEPWVVLQVRYPGWNGPVTCELEMDGGSFVRLGSFDLSDGSGSWGAPARVTLSRVTGVVLLGRSGRLLALGTFDRGPSSP